MYSRAVLLARTGQIIGRKAVYEENYALLYGEQGVMADAVQKQEA